MTTRTHPHPGSVDSLETRRRPLQAGDMVFLRGRKGDDGGPELEFALAFAEVGAPPDASPDPAADDGDDKDDEHDDPFPVAF
ncbi:hypothetical protein HYALB_00002897 [Hymenoscyphus albidus]|uniref:Uncharacterized protein n=1 Tax=Hymenoscyphus albidus TaxID=595503 RepID=A0A9N9M4E7_9HELO|nr:hypothetical protein HYALB_00002897 [Hymenoscyphus albidus]